MPGTLTTAVIDVVGGAPAGAMLVDLFRLPRNGGERHHLRTIETNDKGTVDTPLLAGDDLVPATYELLYHIGRYFKAQRAPAEDGPFLDVVPVRFAVTDPNRAYRLALMVTPLSYAVYQA
jgi:5-hydroxyisourate hydrolase